MIIGRNSLLNDTKGNLHFWFKVLLISIFCIFPLKGLQNMLPEFIEPTTLRVPLTIIIRMWGNFAFTMILFSSIILVFYQTSLRSKMMHLAPYGKMSLTNYVTQSIIGAFIFYGWGLGAYSYMGHTYSVLTGVVILILQYTFCVYWLKRYNHGPLEYLWKRATWINYSNQIVNTENIAGNTVN